MVPSCSPKTTIQHPEINSNQLQDSSDVKGLDNSQQISLFTGDDIFAWILNNQCLTWMKWFDLTTEQCMLNQLKKLKFFPNSKVGITSKWEFIFTKRLDNSVIFSPSYTDYFRNSIKFCDWEILTKCIFAVHVYIYCA